MAIASTREALALMLLASAQNASPVPTLELFIRRAYLLLDMTWPLVPEPRGVLIPTLLYMSLPAWPLPLRGCEWVRWAGAAAGGGAALVHA